MDPSTFKIEREKDVNKIKNSIHPRKVVVAGPGTGKSYLFQELIKQKKIEDKRNFLAITFIGKLGDALADDLCGLAETLTMHGFARQLFLSYYKKWNYYPKVYNLIEEDLKNEGIESFRIGDENYNKKSNYYKTVGDDDIVKYAIQICKKDENKIPKKDLILVDEFQDFNEIEAQFIDLLALKNEIVIVGDDDQALYEFKGASPSHIRERYDVKNNNFESHTLRFCSRCTEVILKYFHNIVEKFNLDDPIKNRINKEYICYVPDKEKDSTVNSKIYLIQNCPHGMIAYKIKTELEKVIFNQKIKQVLIIGEGRSCKSILNDIAIQLVNCGFKNVYHKNINKILDLNQDVVDAYKFIAKDENSLIGWRILGNPTDAKERKQHIKNAKILKKIIMGTPAKLKKIKDVDIDKLNEKIEQIPIPDKDVKKNLLFKELKNSNINLTRPLSNLEITVCNILNSKGLGADVVFVIGFDNGKFPINSKIIGSEIYQMLVALTRAKKRVYFINTVDTEISSFIDCINREDLDIEEIRLKYVKK